MSKIGIIGAMDLEVDQLKALIDMIEKDVPGNPTIDDVWSAFQVAQAAQESIETGKTIKI